MPLWNVARRRRQKGEEWCKGRRVEEADRALAGDHIKSAADLNVPLVAVTLLYKRGYFIQSINPMGQQEEMYPYFDPRAFMEPPPFKVTIKIERRDVHIGVWKYNTVGISGGRVPIYFLDTDLPLNAPEDRLITQFLYGGDTHTRICQEAVLGIGGQVVPLSVVEVLQAVLDVAQEDVGGAKLPGRGSRQQVFLREFRQHLERRPHCQRRIAAAADQLVRLREDRVLAIVVLAAAILVVIPLLQDASRASDQPGISPETVADYIHAVIEADRTFYTIHVVERQQMGGGAVAAENWRAKKNLLPLPAQFLMESSDLATKTGTRVRYRLISLWPINPHNGPYSELEKQGLEAAAEAVQ